MRYALALTIVALLAVPAFAQHRDLTHDQQAIPNAVIDFGVFPAAPLGPPPCLQAGSIGGPTDPCAYKIHHLTPEEVTILKGGQVSFQIHGGGHAMAIYEVSKDTTREDVGQYLCPGNDPATIADPASHACNRSAANASAPHDVADGKGDVVIAVSPNVTNAHPDNRVWYEPGRLMSAGARQFLPGGTSALNGEILTYQFQKTGRYLVICANRGHFLNDWMFGFVNVTGQ